MIIDQAQTFNLTDLQTWLKDELDAVDQHIMHSSDGRVKPIGDIINHLVLAGGKRMRPMLVLLGAKLFAYSGERHIRMAAVIEFIHSATLLHDDVVDNSSLRRGRPTACSIWGNQTSVLVGDYLLSQAFAWMVKDGSLPVLDLLSATSATIAEGEVLQMTAMHNAELEFTTYYQIIYSKTAALFAAACQIGALITNQSAAIVQQAATYGIMLGVAFQMTDDLLDYTASEAELGKAVGDDFREGKITLPVIVAYKCASVEDKQLLRELFAPEAAVDEVAWQRLRGLLDKYAVETECHATVNKYIIQAKDALADLPDNEARRWLEELLAFIAKRCY